MADDEGAMANEEWLLSDEEWSTSDEEPSKQSQEGLSSSMVLKKVAAQSPGQKTFRLSHHLLDVYKVGTVNPVNQMNLDKFVDKCKISGNYSLKTSPKIVADILFKEPVDLTAVRLLRLKGTCPSIIELYGRDSGRHMKEHLEIQFDPKPILENNFAIDLQTKNFKDISRLLLRVKTDQLKGEECFKQYVCRDDLTLFGSTSANPSSQNTAVMPYLWTLDDVTKKATQCKDILCKMMVSQHITNLTQGLIDGEIDVGYFINNINHNQPKVVVPPAADVLKGLIPSLRYCLCEGLEVIDGIEPPPVSAVQSEGQVV